MKKLLKFAALISLGLGLIGFILMMVTPSVAYFEDANSWYSGTAAIFGKGSAHVTISGYSITGDWEGTLAWTALLAWIFILVAMLIVLCSFVLSLMKKKLGEKLAAILDLVVIGLFLVAAMLMFFTAPAFAGANDLNASKLGLGAGWIIGGILVLAAGVFAALPVVSAFIEKRK
ncbi:MAG: hypothetical protein IJQ67_03675 [Bacilli bacterium]|nr:hypothetical protein [Bacilli bacterium]